MEYPDVVFQCRKCGHLLFVGINKNIEEALKIVEEDCSNCGEEGYGNWILLRAGNFEKEYGDK